MDSRQRTARRTMIGGLILSSVTALAACSSSSSSGGDGNATGGSKSAVKIGLVIPLTGPLGSGFAQGRLTTQARVKYINDHGGANGHPIKLVTADAQSTPQGTLAATQSVVAKGVVGIVSADNTLFDGAAAKYAASKHVPVTAIATDKEETNDPNFFTAAPVQGTGAPASTALGEFFKTLGVSKVVGIGWGNSAASRGLANATLDAAKTVGISTSTDFSATTTTTDYTPQIVRFKSSGAEAIYTQLGIPGNEGVARAVALQKVHPKAVVFNGAMLQTSTLKQPGAQDLNGDYIWYDFMPIQMNAAPAKAYQQVLSKYEPSATGDYYATIEYISTDLLIRGIAAAQGDITPTSVTAGLKSLKSYGALGLTTSPVNESLSKADPSNVKKCWYVVKVENKKFVPQGTSPVCGKLVNG